MKEVAAKQFNAGLDIDTNPKFASEGSYRFALNSILESREGNMPSLSNELGNEIAASLTSGFTLIGTVLTNTDDIVVFSTNNVTSEIGIFNPVKQSYTTYIKSSCLGFNTKYTITSLFNIRKGCERMIYFTDKYNKYRAINLDSLESYTDAATVEIANDTDNWNCDEFNLSPNYQIPVIDLIGVENSGGALKVGTYQFVIQYIDEDGNYSPWFEPTNPVPITVGNPNGDYRRIYGGLAIPDTAEAEEGSVPTTNKSIYLELSNMDTSYPYFRIAALHSTSNIGRVTEVWYLEPVAIVDTNQVFAYRGPNTSTDIVGSLAEINIDITPIHVAKAHAQIDQSLWLGNLEGVKYDYADFQRKASLITTSPAIKTTQVTNALNPGDPKNAFTWWEYRGFTPDEVYSFGIQYLFKDGSWSPVFHIPGRISTGDELSTESSVESAFLGSGSFPKWRIYNTSDGSNFAYHETLTNTYPNIIDCSGESVWGLDSNGYTLASKKIRHHRFPSRRTIKAYDQDSDSINILGVKFEDVEYPHGDIVGHRFMMAERTEENKTVLDNGFMLAPSTELNPDNTTYTADSATGFHNDHFVFTFHSPKTLIENRYLNATHYDLHTGAGSSTPGGVYGNISEGEVDAEGLIPAAITSYVGTYGNGPYATPVSVPKSIATTTSTFVGPRTSQSTFGDFSYPLINNSHLNTVYFVHYTPDLTGIVTNGLLVASAKKIIDPYSSLSSQVYYPIHNNYYTELDTDQVAYGGDNFTTYINFIDTAFVNALEPNNQYVKTILGQYYSGVWVDSEINYALRHGGTSRCNSIYTGEGAVWEHFRTKFFDADLDTVNPITGQPTVDTKYRTREDVCEEYYAYNKDYSKIILEKPGVSLSYRFDYCSECLNSFPNRIRVSQKNYQENSLDSFRVFKDGDRNDLSGNSGDLTALVVYNDNLYALCERDPYMIPINAQTIQTSESLAYLGTGERLAIPPRRLSSAQYPFAGCKHSLSTLVTEFGVLYVDYLSNKIFLLGPNGLQDISMNGMRKFFQTNIQFELDKQFKKVLGIEFPYIDSPTYEYGLGFTTAYDPEFKRIIISKRDYRLRDDKLQLLSNLADEGLINWSGDKFVINRRGTAIPIDFTDKNYFENKSWTISYYLLNNKWMSFHSYLPNLLFNDSQSYYSVINTNKIWKHNAEKYQTYYGTKKDYILDITATKNPTVAAVYNIFDINCDINDGADSNNYFFDYAIIYNNYQTTGKLPIVINTDSFTNISNSLVASKVERNWRLSDFRDMVTDYTLPLFSNDWDDINNSYFIDKVPNPDAINTNKSFFEQGRLRDHYVGCRLFFNPDENVKINVDLISTVNQISYR